MPSRRPPDLADLSKSALFLDVDGTLLPIRDDPREVQSDSALRVLLARTATTLNGALALISGRSLAEIDRIFSPLTLNAAGSHGTEVRLGTASVTALIEEPPVFDEMEARILTFVEGHEGLLLERKYGGFTLHFRALPELDGACEALMDAVAAELGPGFKRQRGKMIHEVVASELNKGAAIRHFMDHAPFANCHPVFIGDDTTDEAGFLAINELEGISVKVGEHTDTAARYHLSDTTAVRDWLLS